MTTLTVQNLKCGGCANTITKAVQSIKGITDVEINKDTSEVTFQAENDELIDQVKSKLAHLGYPEVHDKNTMLHKGVSYVSCAMGRMQKN